MFTIRLQRPGGHTMTQCRDYSVSQSHAPGTCALELINDDGSPPRIVTLSRGESAYVMNDQGRTVDTIRPEVGSPRAAAFRATATPK